MDITPKCFESTIVWSYSSELNETNVKSCTTECRSVHLCVCQCWQFYKLLRIKTPAKWPHHLVLLGHGWGEGVLRRDRDLHVVAEVQPLLHHGFTVVGRQRSTVRDERWGNHDVTHYVLQLVVQVTHCLLPAILIHRGRHRHAQGNRQVKSTESTHGWNQHSKCHCRDASLLEFHLYLKQWHFHLKKHMYRQKYRNRCILTPKDWYRIRSISVILVWLYETIFTIVQELFGRTFSLDRADMSEAALCTLFVVLSLRLPSSCLSDTLAS